MSKDSILKSAQDSDGDYKSGIGPAWSPGVTKIISVDGNGMKVPGSEQPAAQPPKPEPHVEGKASGDTSIDTKDSGEVVKEAGKKEPARTPEPVAKKESTAVVEAKAEEDTDKTADPVAEDKTQEFLKISRRERKLLAKEKELKELETRLTAQGAKVDRIIKAAETAKTDPVPLLEAAGISYDDITKALLSKEQPSEVATVKKEVEELKTKLSKKEEDEKASADAVAEGEAEKFFATKMGGLIEEHKDEFELCSVMGEKAIDLAKEIVTIYFKKTNGDLLDPMVCLREAEKHYAGLLQSVSGTQKAKRLFSPEPPKEEKAEEKTSTEKAASSTRQKTLTNQHATGAPHPSDRKKSREERLKDATSMLRWIEQ